MPEDATITVTPDGTILGVGRYRAHMAPGFGHAPQIVAAADDLIQARQALIETHRDEAIAPALRVSAHGRALTDAIRVGYGAAVQRKRDHAARVANLDTPAETIDRSIEADARALSRSLKPADQARWIEAVGLDELAALNAHPELAGLDPALVDRLRERYREENLVAKLGIGGQHPALPDLDGDLVAVGVDQAAVRADAAERLAEVATVGEAIKSDERTVRGLVGFVAALFDIPPAEALAAVTP